MRWLLLLVLLASCSVKPDADDRAERRAKREAAAAAHVAKPPTAREHAMENGALVVLDVPTTDGYSKDRQKCFVWRDSQFRTANITCPSREVYIGE